MSALSSGAESKRYRVTNWRDYNRALVSRGDFTLWFSDEVVAAWEHANEPSEEGAKKNGRPFTYSDVAIETLLTIRELFRLPYRQTEGFGRALAKLLGAPIAIPHHTSLQKRAARLGVAIAVGESGERLTGAVDVVVDSTGLKVYGDGEWKAAKHGAEKRRTWRKVHLAVDPDSHAILAQVLTESGVADADAVDALLDQIDEPVEKFYADGAYDWWSVHERLEHEAAEPVIPPRKNAKTRRHGNSSKPRLPRDEAVRTIRAEGRDAWEEQVGYHRRSLVETAMSRLKGAFGERLKNRAIENQATELALRCKLLNTFVALGTPIAIWG